MDECGSRIRRRVSVRKRNRPSLETTFATPTAAELKPSNEEKEEEEKAGSRRRKTVGVQPLEVQPDQLSKSPEFLIPFPAFGAMVQPKPPTAHTH